MKFVPWENGCAVEDYFVLLDLIWSIFKFFNLQNSSSKSARGNCIMIWYDDNDNKVNTTFLFETKDQCNPRYCY